MAQPDDGVIGEISTGRFNGRRIRHRRYCPTSPTSDVKAELGWLIARRTGARAP
jgi:hypothetical protein